MGLLFLFNSQRLFVKWLFEKRTLRMPPERVEWQAASRTADCIADCCIQWVRRRASAILAARHTQSMQVAVDDTCTWTLSTGVHSSWRYAYISIQGPRCCKWSAAAPEANDWSDMVTAPDTKRAAVFCIQIAAFSSECQLLLPTKRCSSPTDSAWSIAPVISKRPVSKTVGRRVADTSGNKLSVMRETAIQNHWRSSVVVPVGAAYMTSY